MMPSEEIRTLINAHFEDIKIEYAGFVHVDEAISYIASLNLIVPTIMLRKYSKLKMSRKRFPDGQKFWKESNLASMIRDSEKHNGQGDATSISDVLDYLGGVVLVNYKELANGITRMSITEIPELYIE